MMHAEKQSSLLIENIEFKSTHLKRLVKVDCFLPVGIHDRASLNLLLINDGQNMEELGLSEMLEKLFINNEILPLLCVGIHAGDRKMEYGTAGQLDYLGRGYMAASYTQFIFKELIPFLQVNYRIPSFKEKSFAGFSLGGLSALDIVWNHPQHFTKAGVFSGSLWWRTKSLEDGYVEDSDRIVHGMIRKGTFVPGLKFFFETGTLDETMDRNNNGIIDSIDDTMSLMDELAKKGYSKEEDMFYLELEDGRHDTATWAVAMPKFLKWGWGKVV